MNSTAGDEAFASYEEERMANIKNNAALLASLGLNATPAIRAPQPQQQKKPVISSAEERTRRETRAKAAALKRAVEPTRRSARVAHKPADIKSDANFTYADPPSPSDKRRDPIPRGVAPKIPSGPEYDLAGPSTRAPRPGRAKDGTLIFEDRWAGVFTPNVTPEEMFTGGAFAGAFFCDTYSRVRKEPLVATADVAELPFTVSDPSRLLSNEEPDGDINRFKVRAGQSLAEWEKAGWIWSEDPRGWAQWYVRFWEGRRCEDDVRQISRWQKVAGPTGRFKRALLKKMYQAGGVKAVDDEDVGRVLRQCLWQWGYELNKTEYDAAMEA